MTDLSPQAQAVLDASNLYPCNDSRQIIAATLRAAADQVVPVITDPRLSTVRFDLLAIAAELESTSV